MPILWGKIDSSTEEIDEESESVNETIKGTGHYPIREVVVNTKENSAFRVELSKDSKDYSSVIANEIVGNLKMVGYSFVIGFVCWCIFMLCHQKDICSYPELGWGMSCYDKELPEHYYVEDFDWHSILIDLKKERENVRRGLGPFGDDFPVNPSLRPLFDKSDKELEKDAKESAEPEFGIRNML